MNISCAWTAIHERGNLMSARLYVDGLLASIDEQELKTMFSRFGHVLSAQIYQPGTPAGSGVGAVEMASIEEAQKAISALHHSYLGGIFLLVFLASLGAQS